MTDCDALSALSPGAPLWLIPPLTESPWAPRIDWYLGFQIRRALPHQSFNFSSEMTELIDAYEKSIPPVVAKASSPLMIASSYLLPNHQTVLVSETDPAAWVKSCHRIWTGLDRPATRVFLPKSLSRETFKKSWPQADAQADLQLVASN